MSGSDAQTKMFLYLHGALHLQTRRSGLGLTLVWLFLMVSPFVMLGQTKKELESKRKKISKEITDINKELGRTSKNRQATYAHYVALQSQIKKREELITTIQSEVVEIDHAVKRNTSVISSLTADIADRQLEYGRLMRSSLRFKTLTNPLVYILSATSLNQAYRRWVFLRKYDRYRKQQAEAIAFTRAMLTRKTLALEEMKLEKSMLLGEETSNKSQISTEMEEKNKSLQTLLTDEQRLRKDLEEKKQAAVALDKALEDIIREEVRKAAEARAERERKARERRESEDAALAKESRSGSKAKKKERTRPAEPTISVEDEASRDFINKKGKLTWPVSSGFISRPFGNVSHPVYKDIRIQNNGVDIRTEADASVSAIQPGDVVGVTFVPGHDYSVIVQHGNFYSVYANLAQAFVSKGDKLSLGQSVGRVSMNPISGESELHFEIWLNKERLNPESWISR